MTGKGNWSTNNNNKVIISKSRKNNSQDRHKSVYLEERIGEHCDLFTSGK